MAESPNTTLNKEDALNVFIEFLATKFPVAPTARHLEFRSTWLSLPVGITVEFKQWMIEKGYAISTVNNRLTHVRGVARMAAGDDDLTIEQMVFVNAPGISHRVGKNIVEYRKSEGLPTRVGSKKEKHIELSTEQCDKLKTVGEDTPQGRRDRLLMCLLLDHGLRPKDVTELSAGKQDALKWSDDTHSALRAYIDAGDCPTEPDAKLLRASLKSGALGHAGMTVTGCSSRVRYLGKHLGIHGLTPSDCKHYFDNNVATPEMKIRKLEKKLTDVLAENIALKRALRSKQAASPRMPKVISWSSSEIEDTD